MANESTTWLYEQLTNKGYNVGKDVNEFDSLMQANAQSRQWAYETATNCGFNVGKDIDEFTSLVVGRQQPTQPSRDEQPQANAATAPMPGAEATPAADANAAPSRPRYYKLRRGGRDFTVPEEEVEAAGGLTAWWNKAVEDGKAGQPMGMNLNAPYRVYMHGKDKDGNDFDGHVAMSVADERRAAGYDYTFTDTPTDRKPTLADRKRSAAQLANVAGHNEKVMDESKEWMEDMQEYSESSTLTPKPVESSLELDPNTGEASRTYLTHGGRRMKDKDAAEWEELKYRLAIADSDMSLAAQLRRAYEERDYLISKANARRAALTREDNTPGVLSSIMSSGDAITGATSATTSATSQRLFEDTEYQQYREAISEVNNRIQTLENRRYVDNGGDQGFWRTFGQTVSTPETWVGAMSTDFLSASGRLSANAVDTSSARALKKAIAETDEAEAEYGDFGFFSRAGAMTGYMLPFMLDFAVTGGGFEAINVAGRAATKGAAKLIGREAIQEMATMGVKAYAKQYGAKGVGRMAGNWTIKALGTTADELLIRAPLMTNTVQAGKTVSDIVDRKLGSVEVDEYGNYDFTNDKTWGSAVWQGEANAIIENYSEMFGTHLEGIMPALAKTFGGKRISGMLARANASSFGQVLGTTRKHFQRMGVSDYFGEVSEEYYGQLWRTMLNLDDAKNGSGENLLLDGQFHGDIWGGMALSMGMMGIGKYTMASAVYAEKKHQVSKADRLASEVFTPEKWEPLRDIIDNTTNTDMGDLAEQVITDTELTDKEREAALDYMERSLNFRGYNLATTAQSRGAEQDPTEAQLSNSYLDGYNAGTSDEMADAQNMYERQRLRAQERFGLRGAIFMDHNPVEVISQMRQSGASEEDIQLALDFANAKALRDGMIRRVNDNIDEQIAQSNAKIDASVNNKTGMIHPARLVKADGSEWQVDVVGGALATHPDGTIDVENSDESLIVRYNDGKLEFVTPKDFSFAATMPFDPAEQKAQLAEVIRRDAAQSAANALNGVRRLNSGDVVTIMENGNPVEVTINGPAVDPETGQPLEGQIDVEVNGESRTVAAEWLQQAAREADAARIDEFERNRAQGQGAEQRSGEGPRQKPKPQFKLNDEFTITYQGQPVRGSITGELDEEGKIEIYTEEATINGQQVIRITPEELEMILATYNGEDLTEPSSEGEGEGGYGADNWRESRPDDNYGYLRRADIATDRLIEAARQGNEEAAAILAEYGEEIGTPGVYRFARKEEVDTLQRGKHYAGRNGDGKVDVTASDTPTSAASGEFRIKFKPDFDLYKVGNGRTRMKNAEKKDGWIMDGYDIADVESIEQLQPDGTYAEVWHADAQAESAATVGTVPPQAPARSRVPVDEQGHPKYDDVDPDTAWDAIVEEAEGDEAIAAEVVADILEDRKAELTAADKALTKAKEGKPEKRKASDPQPTMADRIAAKRAAKESLDQAQAARDRAQAAVDRWTKIAESKQRRANERLNAEQAEARRRAEALAQEEARLRAEREDQARKEREALNGVPDWQLDTAADARSRGYRRDGAKKVERPEVMDNYAWGNRVQVKFGDGIIPEGYAVVIEAEQLQPSHLDGKRNPSHFLDEAQPKNRKDGASRAAADRIAREIRPEEITSSVTAFTGAPSINGRGEVIQGNNRGDALRRMYEGYPQSAEKYRQYLIDHAQDFGLTPGAISAFSHPVLVNMLDVTDDEAIHYGQYAAQDTESGGVERIKPKNAVQRMGNEVSTFAALLLRSADDEASFSQLVDDNGVEVLKWMSRKGFISDTQYASAFDSNGNLSAEAANDLKSIMYQSIFTGGSTRLEETFNKMPTKAQRAILATAFRDNESPESERLLGELQQSVTAFGSLMGFEQFRDATNPEAVAQAIAAWKRQTSFDDVSGEAYLPAEKFSELAIALAALYKSATQKQIQSTFNSIYDLVQGTVESDLFGEADTTQHPLSEAVQRVMGIEYQPKAKPTAEQVVENLPNAEAEMPEEVNVNAQSMIGRSLTEQEATELIAKMESVAEVAQEIELTIENWDAEFGEDGIVETPIGKVKMGENQFTKLMRQGRNTKLGMVKPTLVNPDIIVEDSSNAKEGMPTERESSYVFVKAFIKQDGSRYYYFTSVTVSKDGHEVVISNQEKRRNVLTNLLRKGKLVWKHADDVSTASDIADGLYSEQREMSDSAFEGTDAPQTNNSANRVDTVRTLPTSASSPAANEKGQGHSDNQRPSARKVSDSATEKQESSEKSSESNIPLIIDPREMSDEERKRRGDMLRNAEPVHVATGLITAMPGKSARKTAEEWWDKNIGAPILFDTEAGEVEIDKTSIKDSLSHGYRQEKLDAVTSLSEGFSNAVYLGSMEDFTRPGVMSHYFAYPITYEGQRRYVFCRAMADNNKNRLYVHEVFMAESINESDTLQTIASASSDGELHGGIALYKAILKNVLDVSTDKGSTLSSKEQEKGEKSSIAQSDKPSEVEDDSSDTSDEDETEAEAARQYQYRFAKRNKEYDNLTPKQLREKIKQFEEEVEDCLSSGNYALVSEAHGKEGIIRYLKELLAQKSKRAPRKNGSGGTPNNASTAGKSTAKAEADARPLSLEDMRGSVKEEPTAPSTQEEHKGDRTTPLMDKIAKGRRLDYIPGILDKLCEELAITPEIISEFEPSDEIYESIGRTKDEIDSMSAEELEKLVPDVIQQIESGWRQALQELKDRMEQTSNADEKEQFEQQQDAIKQHGDTVIAVFVATLANLYGQKTAAEKSHENSRSAADDVSGTTTNPSGNRLVTDERYAQLRERMRKKLGGQLNMGVDPEILAIGAEMAVYHIEKGARKFKAYASAMIADLGDAIRPYLKAFYNAVRDMPEAVEAGLVADMDSYDDVRKVDIANFDKTTTDAMATAAAVVAEEEAEKQKAEAEKILKKQRKERHNPDTKSIEKQRGEDQDVLDASIDSAPSQEEPVKYESELGSVIDEAWKRYSEFKDSDGFEPKKEALDECYAILTPLSERISSMSSAEVEAVARDLDTFVKRLPDYDDEWTRYKAEDFGDIVMNALHLEERIKAIEQEESFNTALDVADELTEVVSVKGKPKISDFVAGKDARTPVIQGVYHDPAKQMAVATDTYLLVMSANGYDASFSGKIMGSKGEIYGNYPNVTRIIPTEDAVFAIAEDVDFAELEGKARAAARADKNAQVAVVCPDGKSVLLTAERLQNFARAARMVGASELKMYQLGGGNAIMAEGPDGKVLAAGMAMDEIRPLHKVTIGASTTSLAESAENKSDISIDSEQVEESVGSRSDGHGKIEDFGEKISGARKDALRDVARSVENVTVQSLIELPLSKAFKRPSLKKLVDSGAISDEDALLAEAVMQSMIYAQKKPILTRKPQSKSEIAAWAQSTYEGIKLLGEVLSGKAERKAAAIAAHEAQLSERLYEVNAHIAKIRGWNPGQQFNDLESYPDPIAITKRVLEGAGYRPGDKVELPLTRIELTTSAQRYVLNSPGKQKAYWFERYHDTLDSAIATMVLAARLTMGDMDVEIPQQQYSIRGVGNRHKEPTGKYAVQYIGPKNAYDYREAVFDSEEKADDFAKNKNGRVVAQERYTNDYDRYAVVVINPLTGNAHQVGEPMGTRAEAVEWLDEHPEEVNAAALEAIYKETGRARGEKEHFYVSVSFLNGKTIYSVVSADKTNPWPIVKDFVSRKEAEEWLEANKASLEAERKARKEKEKSVVYFDTAQERVGEDYRHGKDATPELFAETFGFRGVQFGNWTNDADRQEGLNQAYDALLDMARALGITPRAVSLDGELGLAFGARGSGNASAHYEPTEVVINLTKTRGAGTLAHEWWHAVDNYLSRRAGVPYGYASHLNGLEQMNPEVRKAVESMMTALSGTYYTKRSALKGDYWGRPTEIMARLFGTWIAWRLRKDGNSSPFLASEPSPRTISLFQTLNYLAYKRQETMRAEREGRMPELLTQEEFNKKPESLYGYPYPTETEVEQFAPWLESIFAALAKREHESGSMANSPMSHYGSRRKTMSGASLFDWADSEKRRVANETHSEQDKKAEAANSAVDSYCEAFKAYAERIVEIEKRLTEVKADSAEALALNEQHEYEQNAILEARSRLEEELKSYYTYGNSAEDAIRIARDMTYRVQAEVTSRLNSDRILRDILEQDRAPQLNDVPSEAKNKEAKTADGSISYDAIGHLPDANEGEFGYVERRFSLTGEFGFTGNEQIRDRGDVAYLFRSLENYAVEHVFAVLVKDGKFKVIHLGMGSPTTSAAYMGAIRAGYDAFGAEKIYLVHNHPSGNLMSSPQDRGLMRVLEQAFDGVRAEGIIMDTTSGRYHTFNSNGAIPASENVTMEGRGLSIERNGMAERPREGDSVETAVMRFDRMVPIEAKEHYESAITPETVERFISGQRLGAKTKVCYMVLTNSLKIVGNFHTEYASLKDGGLAEEIASAATKFGGTRVIVYGNMELDGVRVLGEEVKRLSLQSISLTDAMSVKNGLRQSAHDEGLLHESGEAYMSEAHEPMMSDRSHKTFDALRERAIAERGIVMPGLNEASVSVVDVPRHDFSGTGKQAIGKARTWAMQNLVGEHLYHQGMPNGFTYQISESAIDKYLSASSTTGSDNLGVHLAALKMLPSIIDNSIEAEIHADYAKADGTRSVETGVKNSNILMHRYYGAIRIGDTLYRVKTTVRETRGGTATAYNYQVTELELLISGSEATSDALSNSNSISVAKLLNGVEKSYDFGKKLLEESKIEAEDDILTRMGDGYGPYTDMELADADDIYAKVFGKSRYSKKQKIEYAARKRRNMATAAQEVAEALHLDNVEIVTDASALDGKRAKAKGFYNKQTGKITIVIPNHQDAFDVKKTVFHEAVAHYGLRKLFGKHFDTFLDKVYERADEEIRRKIASLAAKNGWDFRTATEEYLASLAEDTGFADRVNARFMPDWWMKVKELFIQMLNKLGIHAFDDTSLVLTDNELRYILWRSYRNLEEPGGHRSIIGVAEDVAMQSELKVGNYAPNVADIATASEQTHMELMAETFDQQLAQYERGELKPGHRFELGMPSRFLLSAGFPNLPISMRASLLARKSGDMKHPFAAADLTGLVEAIQKPIAIFEYSKSNICNLIVDVKHGDKHFLIGVTLNYKAGDIEINSVSGIFPKESHEWVKWIQDGKAIRIDQKEKVQAVIASLRTNPAESERIGLNLDDVAKIVNNFENPTITEDDSILFRSGETTEAEQNHETAREGGFTPRDRAIARDYYNRMTSTGGYQFQEAVQDSMLGLKKLYKAIIGGTRIEDVADFENAYTFENRMSSATKGQQHEYFIRYMQPLLREIGEITGADKAKRRSLINYLMAKHGLERNEYMRRQAAENNENTDRDFAGLTGLTRTDNWQLAEETAQDWVDQYEAEHDTEPLWRAIRRATEASLQKIYLSGLLSKENYEKILGMYQYYIPLRGWDETTSDEVYGYLTSKDGPLGGSIVKKAKGRESVADDPIATIAMMADDAIRQGNRNIMKQRFLNFVLNHPSDLVSVHDLWLQFDEPSGEWQTIFPDINENDTPDDVDEKIAAFEERMEALRAENPDKYKRGRETQNVPYKVVKGHLKEHQVLIKRNGRTYVATINGNPRAAQALNGLTNPDVDQNGVVGNMLKLGTWVNRQLSAFYTTRNPDFVASNFFLDMLYSNCMTWVKESPRYALRFHKNFGRVNPITMRRLLGKWESGTLRDDDRLEHLFNMFMMNGGETGYTDVRDIEGHKRAIAAELRKQGSVGRRVWTALGMQLDLLNRSAENCARFAAFITSIEFGRTVGRAVYDAKEISVNFNKKGSGGKMVNAVGQTTLGKVGAYLGGSGRILYVFWNAGIQGMTNFGRQAKRHPAKFTAGATALFVLGYLMPILAKMLSGDDGDDDDKNAYYNLPEYIRRQNICLYAGEQWITIPLPIEFRAMYGLGELAHGVISGDEHYSNDELAFQMAAQVSQIMPLDMLEGGGGATPYIPSAAKPFTEAYIMNRDWTGLPVYKDTPFNKNDPEWTKAYASADTHLVDFARWLNEISGGDDYKKGAIDINPAKIEHVLSSTFGGVISFPNKLNKTGETVFGDREFEWRNIPIANRLVKSGDERTANRKLKNEYYKYREEYNATGSLLRKYENAEADGILGYAEKVNFMQNSPEYARWLVFDDFKDEIKAYQTDIAEATNAEERKQLEAQMYARMRELVNALHNPEEYLRDAVAAPQDASQEQSNS